jgi:uncharacterized membrane protein YccC
VAVVSDSAEGVELAVAALLEQLLDTVIAIAAAIAIWALVTVIPGPGRCNAAG